MKHLIKQIAIGWILGNTAFAGEGQPSSNPARHHVQNTIRIRRSCYVLLSGSPFPQPCERLGAKPSTAIPMDVIGEPPKRIIKTQIVAPARN